MRLPIAPSFISSCALSSALLLCACDSFYVVKGRVVRCEDKTPVANATVEVELSQTKKQGKEASKEDGTFSVAVNHPPTEEPSVLTVSAPGFAPKSTSVTNTDTPQVVCLGTSIK
jgi:hypothetical protein